MYHNKIFSPPSNRTKLKIFNFQLLVKSHSSFSRGRQLYRLYGNQAAENGRPFNISRIPERFQPRGGRPAVPRPPVASAVPLAPAVPAPAALPATAAVLTPSPVQEPPSVPEPPAVPDTPAVPAPPVVPAPAPVPAVVPVVAVKFNPLDGKSDSSTMYP